MNRLETLESSKIIKKMKEQIKKWEETIPVCETVLKVLESKFKDKRVSKRITTALSNVLPDYYFSINDGFSCYMHVWGKSPSLIDYNQRVSIFFPTNYGEHTIVGYIMLDDLKHQIQNYKESVDNYKKAIPLVDEIVQRYNLVIKSLKDVTDEMEKLNISAGL